MKTILLGVKTDPIETRYSYEWLFDLLAEEGIRFVQLGSFFELYHLPESYFVEVREKAAQRGLRIKSVFTAHRELGGFFYDDPRMERVARANFEKLIHVGAALGADYVGSNPGAVLRDHPEAKERGIDCYLGHMKELQELASQLGLHALTMEPMSCMAEPPSTSGEMRTMVGALNDHHRAHMHRTVPVYLCGDISHGIADANQQVVHSNVDLFRAGIPMMAEFHFKNTDAVFNSTFGFSEPERVRGIVDLGEIRRIACEECADQWPVDEVVGYLEIGGPKIGRDYSDPLLADHLRESLAELKSVFQ